MNENLKKYNNIEYSVEVQEIMEKMPNWFLRFGTGILLIFLMMLILFSWIIKYPDTINSRAVFTTRIPPASLVARTQGELQLLVKDNQTVRKGQYLGFIENPARVEDVQSLIMLINRVKQDLGTKKEPVWGSFQYESTLMIGELQGDYNDFIASCSAYEKKLEVSAISDQIVSLEERLTKYRALGKQLLKQQELQLEALQIAQRQIHIDKELYLQKVLAELEYRQKESVLLMRQSDYESTNSNIINNQLVINQTAMQIKELKFKAMEIGQALESNFMESFKILENRVLLWEQQYVLKAPVNGSVTLTKYNSNSQFVNTGDEIMVVVPQSDQLYGKALVPVTGSGNINVGQKVNIRFDNYPFHEYGNVEAQIKSISLVPREGNYHVELLLTKGLTTNYGKQLEFKQEMQGNAEIITKDMRVIDRIFNRFQSLLIN